MFPFPFLWHIFFQIFLYIWTHIFPTKIKSYFTEYSATCIYTHIVSSVSAETENPIFYAAAAAKLLQPCLTLCSPIDGSPPGFPVPGILQARTLEWVAISFSNAWKWKVKVKSLSCVWLSAAPWTAASIVCLNFLTSPPLLDTIQLLISFLHKSATIHGLMHVFL